MLRIGDLTQEKQALLEKLGVCPVCGQVVKAQSAVERSK